MKRFSLFSRGRHCAAWLLVVFAVTGCGGGKHQIEGRVVWADGKPATELAGYSIDFESHENKLSASGTIKSDGTFTLGTDRVADGVSTGTYKVAINAPLPGGDEPVKRSLLPDHYSRPDSSGLVETIDGSKRTVELKLERRTKK